MEAREISGSFFQRCRSSMGGVINVSVLVTVLLGVCSQALEMSVGKIHTLEVVNGSSALMPCTYASCIGIKNLYFNWTYNRTETLVEGVVPMEGVEAHVSVWNDRVDFVGSSRTNNVSIILRNITFDDQGDYICYGKNPKEKGRNHSAILTLIVVDQLREVDNTLTTIITSVVGGVIGLLILIMILKSVILLILRKRAEKNKECLVSSGNDNTENGLSGSKADNKATPKA